MEPLRRLAGQVDDVVYRVERMLLLLSLSMMTVLVTLDVIQRSFSRQVGKTEGLLLSIFYTNPSAEQTAFVVDVLGPVLFAALAALFFVLATHSSRSIRAEREKRPLPGFGKSVGVGLALSLGAAVFVKALLFVFPSSVPGAQKFALGFMLWSGMLGASLATRTRRHIVLDPIKKKLDAATLKPFSLLGGLLTFAFCAFLAALGLKQLMEQFGEWASGDGIGVYDALPIPLWVVTLAIPVTFSVMALRFLGQGIHDFKWGPPKGGADAHGIDLEALEKEQLPLDGGAP
ncbi:MAG: TRAP transporter small permease [Archangium sp.]|nr:TRAP transporter small permease [Archangium sp.]MDP3151295.1 TRAP transporter small permease [Archangium sp.]MDP3571648.1 TRAP transporter small permease [Archangium sp.]